MNWLGLARSLHTRYWSKPVHERKVYRLVHRHRCRRLVELGLGSADRARRLIQVAAHRCEHVAYTGIDRFEGRAVTEGADELTLKQVHRLLAGLPAHVQLVPGEPLQALARIANAHPRTDLLLIGRPFSVDDLGDAWFYVPRMLHAGSIVLAEHPGEGDVGTVWEPIEREAVEELAEAARRRKRAA